MRFIKSWLSKEVIIKHGGITLNIVQNVVYGHIFKQIITLDNIGNDNNERDFNSGLLPLQTIGV